LTPEDIRAGCLDALQEPQAACQRLIDLANKKGGEDNITVVLIVSKRP
jgi:serine/threonine protein phosphatase PrpC